jgi:hypothetical protein
VTTPVGESAPEHAALTKADQSRLARLARGAGCNAADILRDVLRDGFDYTEFGHRTPPRRRWQDASQSRLASPGASSECPLRRLPFLLIYRIEARAVKLLRVINSRGGYLNERAKRGR